MQKIVSSSAFESVEQCNRFLTGLLEDTDAKQQIVCFQVVPQGILYHVIAVIETPFTKQQFEDYQVRLIKQVECYISGSGNTTWKAYDEDGYIVYLRQAYRDMLIEAGLWDQLNAMPVNESRDAEIIIHTVKDGDFLKPVKIEAGGKVFESADS